MSYADGFLVNMHYYKTAKYCDRQVWSNSADPDQTFNLIKQCRPWSDFKNASKEAVRLVIQLWLNCIFGHFKYCKTKLFHF